MDIVAHPPQLLSLFSACHNFQARKWNDNEWNLSYYLDGFYKQRKVEVRVGGGITKVTEPSEWNSVETCNNHNSE